MLSAAYSTDCTTFDPKGKILQVNLTFASRILITIDRLRKRSCQAGIHLAGAQV